MLSGPTVEAGSRRDAGRNESVGVDGRDDAVSVAVEDDEWHGNSGPGVPPFCIAPNADATSCAAHRQARCGSCSGVQVRVSRGHDCRHGTARGEPSDVDPRLIDGVLAHDLTGDASENRRLTGVTLLVAGTEPVPVATIVRRSRLLGIGDEERMLLGQVVHPGAGRKSVASCLPPCSMTTSGTGSPA